ncbi:hypothetical protein ACWEO2_31895 [Nocardia sp. NPDC004278]
MPGRVGRAARPDLPLVVGLDGGYIHSSQQRSRWDGWFEVIAGKTMPADGGSCCFGYVQTHDTKPKRRLFEVLAGQLSEVRGATVRADGPAVQRDQHVLAQHTGAADRHPLPVGWHRACAMAA